MQPSRVAVVDGSPKVIYWHRELPPLDAEPIGEHTIEATSSRVPGTIAHRDELWTRCEDELMAQSLSSARRPRQRACSSTLIDTLDRC